MGVITAYRQTLFLDLKDERCPDSAIFSLSTLANSERSGEPVIRASSATVPF